MLNIVEIWIVFVVKILNNLILNIFEIFGLYLEFYGKEFNVFKILLFYGNYLCFIYFNFE